MAPSPPACGSQANQIFRTIITLKGYAMELEFMKTLVLDTVGVLNSKMEELATLIDRDLSFKRWHDINWYISFFLVYTVVLINETRGTQETKGAGKS
jgi:hypothetical protein